MGTFPRGLPDCVNVPLPCMCTLFQIIMSGLIVPDKAVEVVRTRAHFIPNF